MSFTWLGGYSGEHRDVEMEYAQAGQIGMAIQSADVNTGDRGIEFNHAASGAHNAPMVDLVSASARDNKIHAFSGHFRFPDGSPTADVCMFGQTGSGRRIGRFNTLRQVVVHSIAGDLVAGPSSAVVATDALTHVTVFLEDRSLSTVWVVCVIDDVEQFAVDTGLNMSDFFAITGGTFLMFGDTLGSRGANAKVHADDLTYRRGTADADTPDMTRYPKVVGVGAFMRPPTADGTHTAWTGNGFADVDESPPDDNTTEVGTGGKGDKETYKSYDNSNLNPVPTGFDIDTVTLRARTQLVDAAKLGTDLMMRDSGGNETVKVLPAGTTTYATKWVEFPLAPDASAWVRGDFDDDGGSPDKRSNLQFGFQAHNEPDFDTGPEATAIYFPEVWCFDPTAGNKLPITSTPVVAGAKPHWMYYQRRRRAA